VKKRVEGGPEPEFAEVTMRAASVPPARTPENAKLLDALDDHDVQQVTYRR
jgi:hypothetical protein